MLGAMNLGLDQLGFSWPLTHQYQQPFRVSCQIARAGVAVQLQVDQDQLRRLKAESSDSAAAATQSSATQVVGIATILVLGSFMNKCKFEEVITNQLLNLYILSVPFLLSRSGPPPPIFGRQGHHSGGHISSMPPLPPLSILQSPCKAQAFWVLPVVVALKIFTTVTKPPEVTKYFYYILCLFFNICSLANCNLLDFIKNK